MPDDRTKRGSADRKRINAHQVFERRYWQKALGVTKAELIALVKAHGPMVADVKRARIKQLEQKIKEIASAK